MIIDKTINKIETRALHNVFYIDPNWGAIYKTGMKQGIDLKVRSNLWNFWSVCYFMLRYHGQRKTAFRVGKIADFGLK